MPVLQMEGQHFPFPKGITRDGLKLERDLQERRVRVGESGVKHGSSMETCGLRQFQAKPSVRDGIVKAIFVLWLPHQLSTFSLIMRGCEFLPFPQMRTLRLRDWIS